MNSFKPGHSISAHRKALVCLTVLALNLNMPGVSWAVLSQKPLLVGTTAVPKPNIMLTIDTSGSMNFRHMPEKTTTVNGVAVNVTDSATYVEHPDDDYEAGTIYMGIMPARKNQTDDALLLTQIKFRSPDINTIYYNPKQRYVPWAATATTRYPNASISNAYINPLKQGPSDKAIDLTVNLTERVRRDTVTYFWPGLYYLLKPGTNPKVTSNYDVYDVNDGALTFKKYPGRDDCQGTTTCTQAEEQQNFANWFVYYRTRMLLAKAALSEAFHNINDVARVGWTTIKYASQIPNRASDTNPLGPVPEAQRVKPLNATNRQALLTSIQTKLSADGSTPLRVALDQVGKYFQDTSSKSPWSDDPVNGSNSKSACRRSYNILTTDGYYNDGPTLNEFKDYASVIDPIGDLDKENNLPKYNAVAPYRDKPGTGYENTLADYALKYWMTDLQPGVDDKLKATTDNPATWQHLTQFTMGIGVQGTFDPSRPDNPNGTRSDLVQLTNGTAVWPDPQSTNSRLADQAKIDDLWHAAINSRGTFYSIKDAQSLSAAVRDAIGRTESMELREGGVSTSSSVLSAGTLKFVPEYATGSWRGELYAFTLNAAGEMVSQTPAWRASTVVPAPSARNLWIWNPDNGQTGGTSAFNWDDIGATNKALLTSGSAALVNYLRGDTSNEGTGDSQYRPRAGARLPDFINANPLYVSSGGTSVVFLGGNGGFAHAFNATDGREVFGFVPRGVLGNLSKLADKSYGSAVEGSTEHQYFVDGVMSTADVSFSTAANSKVLLGTLGAGGKGLYALNVTNLSSLGGSSVMWDDTLTNNPEVGYIFSAPVVGQLPNGQWKVFVGNGYDSTNRNATLLVIDLASGAIDSVIAAPAPLTGDDPKGDGNGLGGVRLVVNSDQRVVAAYAGDLTGNLWRFEYRSDGGRMAVGYQGKPLFTATNTAGTKQAITATPAAFPHPDGGTMVLFGTGKLVTAADKADLSVQSVYGVRDRTPATESTSLATSFYDDRNAATVDRSFLTELVITPNTAAPGYYDIRQRLQTALPSGWYVDLDIQAGQRLIYPISPIRNFALIGTVVPSVTAQECSPQQEGVGYNMLLPALTGAQYQDGVFDVNNDGVINSADANSAIYQTGADGGDGWLGGPPGPDGLPGSIQSTGNDKKFKLPCDTNCGGPPTGRQIYDRIWKRLINNIPHH